MSRGNTGSVFGRLQRSWPRRGERSRSRLAVTLALATALSGAVYAGFPQAAKGSASGHLVHPLAGVVTDPRTHQWFGVVPAIGPSSGHRTLPTTCNAENSDCTALTYHGGPVQHVEKDYLLFWTPTGHGAPSAYRDGLAAWLTEVAQADFTPTNQISVLEQYYDLTGPRRTKNFVSYDVANAGSIIDTDAYPTSGCTDTSGGASIPICLTDGQIRGELSRYVASHHLPTGLNVEYLVITPAGVGSCLDGSGTSCSYSSYCGYHSSIGGSSAQILYADLPWAYGVSGCDTNIAFGLGYANADALDPVVGVLSHEIAETMTDPLGNAWWQATSALPDAGYEIGDKCAYIYGSGGFGSTTGLQVNSVGYWNTRLGSDVYLLQLEFDNFTANCVATDTQRRPALRITVSPASPVKGKAATFTVGVTDPNGTAAVLWSFGDGSVASSNPARHTYAKVGTDLVTVVVTDRQGNETETSTRIRVS